MYIEQTGNGQDLFLVHGWRMNLNCWKPLIQALNAQSNSPYRITSVDLPGHGRSIGDADSIARPDTLVEHLLAAAPPNAVWIGWSIGALLAQMAAIHHSKEISALVSIAMGCKYTASADWKHGMDIRQLNAMDRNLTHSPADCIQQFIELQTNETEHSTQTLDRLKTLCAVPCELEELRAGLRFLETADFRATMNNYRGKILFITGEQDSICSCSAVKQSAALCRHHQLTVIPKAGHALPLSHPQSAAQAIDEFCKSKTT